MQVFLPTFAAAVSFALIALMLKARHLHLPLDHPNERSLHSCPMLRTGGVGILGAVIAVALLLNWSPLAIACMGGLAIVCYCDDRASLPMLVRLLAHALAAGIIVVASCDDLNVYWLVFLSLAVMWMTNLYNFMDGSDGLAGGVTVLGFGAYAIAAFLGGDVVVARLSMSVSAAAAAFLLFNFPPAKIFMGDVGSIPLGFLAAVIGLQGWRESLWPLWFPMLVFAPFIFDASVTLARRILRGERFWRAHRSHYYQRLIQLGWSHRKTALVEYGLMLACAGLALWALYEPLMTQIFALTVTLAVLAMFAYAVDRAWHTGHAARSSKPRAHAEAAPVRVASGR